MDQAHLLSPLRYPGSKRRLASYIKQALEINCFKPELYVEAFVGGGSVALQLLQSALVEKIILIDRDPWVASFWQTVFFDTEWLIDRIETAVVSLDVWTAMKASTPQSVREQAWACFFLNRTSFSGILEQRVGPLGGRSQESAYKIDCRFQRQTQIGRIQKIAAFRNQVAAIWSMSWDQGLEKIHQEQGLGKLPTNNVFFYFDPPFFEKADALYRFYFKDKDHLQLRDALLNLQDKWILSYDSAAQVEALYGAAIQANTNGTIKHEIELFYSLSVMQERVRGKEVLLSNLDKLPAWDETSTR